ncbi:MAG: hypothetical protein KDN20_03855 [Verrucomicrobiae bacterium]|nr:hypothetical protein [Verrucomicrobiae bacterium]
MKIFLTNIAIFYFGVVTVFGGNLRFSQMEENDGVEISYHSEGCFHHFTEYYEVKKSDGKFRFSQFELNFKVMDPITREPQKRLLGQVLLSEADIKGLDKLLEYYRGPKNGGSTTSTTLLIEFIENGKKVQVEKIVDNSGGVDAESEGEILNFAEITLRFRSSEVEN